MKRTAVLLLPLVALACVDTNAPVSVDDGPQAALTGAQQGGPERVVAGRVLAAFADATDPAQVAGEFGLQIEGLGARSAFTILRGVPAGNERAVAARLRTDRRVIYAEPDYLRQPTTIDSRLWAFYNPGGLIVRYTSGRNRNKPVPGYVSVADADEDNVEGYAAGGSAVVIGSIDTGVEFGHPEFLSGQLIAGQDWYDGDSDPSDGDGHGTHTTGTMVGRTVGVAGVAGAGPNVQVLVQRVCGALGCPTSAIVSAIYAAADYPGMVAMNMSLGGGSLSQSEATAIAYAASKNVLVIASAGNDGTGTVSCPACDANAISVAASDWLDQHAYYTNWGSGLDITAPGGEMYSNTTDEAGIYSAYRGGGYAYLQGTSMAAPQVSGTAAIVASVTGLRGAALRSRIEGTTDDLGASGYDTNFGHGRLNSYRAVTGNTLTNDPGGSGGGTLAAAFSYSCGGSTTCTFDGSNSTSATSWSWTFGHDNASDTGVSVTHAFPGAGNFDVTLTVGDGSGTDATTQTVSCSAKGKRIRCG
ncbi:MAG: S8 family serine peptidase [Gemmatimonadota bacterium]|nr:S8 family serine peptidase [Gemmatimonadota bacterium]MDH5196430.1 S8 family serine peptidase [Gemmatimonadota bacterium]